MLLITNFKSYFGIYHSVESRIKFEIYKFKIYKFKIYKFKIYKFEIYKFI